MPKRDKIRDVLKSQDGWTKQLILSGNMDFQKVEGFYGKEIREVVSNGK